MLKGSGAHLHEYSAQISEFRLGSGDMVLLELSNAGGIPRATVGGARGESIGGRD